MILYYIQTTDPDKNFDCIGNNIHNLSICFKDKTLKIYNFKNLNERVKLIITEDEKYIADREIINNFK